MIHLLCCGAGSAHSKLVFPSFLVMSPKARTFIAFAEVGMTPAVSGTRMKGHENPGSTPGTRRVSARLPNTMRRYSAGLSRRWVHPIPIAAMLFVQVKCQAGEGIVKKMRHHHAAQVASAHGHDGVPRAQSGDLDNRPTPLIEVHATKE